MDVGEWAKALLTVAHAIRQDIAWRRGVVLQLVRGLRQREQWHDRTQQQSHDHAAHDALSSPPADGTRRECCSWEVLPLFWVLFHDFPFLEVTITVSTLEQK